jgi:hypothetical protein
MSAKNGFWSFPTMALLACFALAGCVRREGRNSDCIWPVEPHAQKLTPGQRGYDKHLTGDAEFAEELAIEYMDGQHWRRSGVFPPQASAGDAWKGCLGVLFTEMAKSHGIPTKEAIKFFGHRSMATDVAVNLCYLLLYGFLAALVAGRLRSRYPIEDGWTPAIVMVTLCSLAFGVAGEMLGQLWSGVVEGIRVGNGHLSYRVDRVPWGRHARAGFILCVIMFLSATAARYWPRRQHEISDVVRP